MSEENSTMNQLKEEITELRLKVEELNKKDVDRRETEYALRESEELYKALFENNPIETVIVDKEGRVTGYNRAKEKLGKRLPKVGDLMYRDYASSHKIDMYAELIDCIVTSGSKEFLAVKYKDQFLDVRISSYSGGAIITTIDITKRKKAEEARRESEEKYRHLIESANDAIFVADAESRVIIEVNTKAEELLDIPVDEIIGMHQSELHPSDQKEQCMQVFSEYDAGNKTGTIRGLSVCRKDGRQIPVEISASMSELQGVAIIQGIYRDVTERLKMEEEMNRASKLESIGVLAGGIAHDFNNLLTALIGNIAMGKRLINSGSTAYERLAQAEKASLRARDLTQQLLTFSRGGAPIKQTTSIIDLLKDSSGFALRGSKVRCEYFISEELWPIEVDRGQLSQVTHNLIINAEHAMPEGGHITISAQNITLGEGEIPKLKGGRYVKISFEDHGVGIRREDISRVFDPYFTTKMKGSGLGLATAYSIISNHNGLLTVESELDVGTSFIVYLPASTDGKKVETVKVSKLFKGKGRILVMDDDELIRDAASELLDSLGYQAECTCDGSEALNAYRKAHESGNPFDVVVMDLTVPGGMGGKEAIKKLIDLDPTVKAVVSSGYANDPVMANYREYGFVGVVPKPYEPEELSKALHDVIAHN